MGSLATQSARSPLADRKDDLYETPEPATRALMDCESLPHRIWEPACGRGAIARVLRGAGHDVWASDLVDYETPEQDCARLDFLMHDRFPNDFEAIVTNPPYKTADDFVRRSLERAPLVCMLLRFAFCESKSRSDILDSGNLRSVHLFRERLTMHRDGWEGPKHSSAIPFAWFVWDRNHDGPATLNRISWRQFAEAL